jgi:hypothetical protein
MLPEGCALPVAESGRDAKATPFLVLMGFLWRPCLAWEFPGPFWLLDWIAVWDTSIRPSLSLINCWPSAFYSLPSYFTTVICEIKYLCFNLILAFASLSIQTFILHLYLLLLTLPFLGISQIQYLTLQVTYWYLPCRGPKVIYFFSLNET